MISENKKPVQGGAVKCGKCGNTGNCPHCNGRDLMNLKKPCKYCQGNGACPTCRGRGWLLTPAIELQ